MPPMGEVNPEIAAITDNIELEQLHKFIITANSEITEEITNIVKNLIDKLAAVFGDDLIKETLDYLAVSRRGLHISDLGKLLGESWDNEKFAKASTALGTPIVVAYDNVLMISAPCLKEVIFGLINPAELKSFHEDIAIRMTELPISDSLRSTETMFHLLMSDQFERAAQFLAASVGQTITNSAAALGGYYAASDENKSNVLSMLECNVENRFELFRRYINDLFLSLAKNNTPENAFSILDGVESSLKAVMGEKNTLDNILLYSLLLMRKATFALHKKDMQEVKNNFDISIGMIERLMSQDPKPSDFSLANCDAIFNIGMICLDMNQEKGAFFCFDNGFKILSRREENNTDETLLLLSSWYVSVCRACEALKNNDKLKDYFKQGKQTLKKAISSKATLAAKNPGLYQIDKDLMVMYNDFGDLSFAAQMNEEALAAYENALIIGERLSSALPDSIEMQVMPTITFDRLGRMYDTLKNTEKAESYFKKSLETRKKLKTKAPKDVRLLNDLAGSYHNLASFYLQNGRKNEIKPFLNGQLDALKDSFEALPSDQTVIPWIDAVLTFGDFLASENFIQESLRTFQDAIKDMQKLAGARVSEPVLNRIATLHYRTGKIQITIKEMAPGRQNLMLASDLWKQLLNVTHNKHYQESIDLAQELIKDLN